MKLNSTGSLTTLIGKNGETIYISYKTPVAVLKDATLYRTMAKYTVTTSKHMYIVNRHTYSLQIENVAQEVINEMVIAAGFELGNNGYPYIKCLGGY